MKTFVEAKDCAGKVVEQFRYERYDGHVVVTFADGTYTAVEVAQEKYDGNLEANNAPLVLDSGPRDACGLVATPEEIEAARAERRARWDSQNRDRDLRLLADLKAKYEGAS